MRVTPATPTFDGAHWDGFATTVAVTALHADGVECCVFDPQGVEHRVELPAIGGGRFAGRIEGLAPGTGYGFRVHGPWDPSMGHRHNPRKLLLDPFAFSVSGNVRPSPALAGHMLANPDLPSDLDSAPYVMRSVVTEQGSPDRAPRPATPLADSVIYETHVKGISKLHPGVPHELRGTYAGLAHEAVVGHLVELGVTAVELLPVHQFVQDQHLLETGRRNYWGYNTIGFFAPHNEYAAGDDPVGEFRAMVDTLHAAGIELILDVVYNHTAEGNHLGPTLCFRGLDNLTWYRLDPGDRARYLNWTGTGNTVNAAHPVPLTLILDSLRYWAGTMGVDGFRFDLATVLGRTHHDFDHLGAFFGAVAQDPVLRSVKLIAEPWDVGPDGYRVGGFPAPWSEWNDKYRDVVRDFWKGSEGTLAEFASRITGSSDVFGYSGRTPIASVNYVTSHDGYTLADLVSYERRHNHANGENNQDGHRDNRSWNGGVEGHTSDPEILELRQRRKRTMLATVALSQGVPMILGGDEMGRTQNGNNNAYNQDNETSWYDWRTIDTEMWDFTCSVLDLRRDHPTFRRNAWLHEHADPGIDHVGWFTPAGSEMTIDDWAAPFARSIALYLKGDTIHSASGTVSDDDFLLMFNAYGEPLEFVLPHEIDGGGWRMVLDTAAWPDVVDVGDSIEVAAYAIVVLERRRGEGFGREAPTT
jgi:isoamylase